MDDYLVPVLLLASNQMTILPLEKTFLSESLYSGVRIITRPLSFFAALSYLATRE